MGVDHRLAKRQARAGRSLQSTTLLSAFEHSPTAQLILIADDPLFTVAAASDGFLQICGYTRQQLIGEDVIKLFSGNSADGDADAGESSLCLSLQRVIATGTPDRIAIPIYDVPPAHSPNGKSLKRLWNVVNTPILNEEGKVKQILHTVAEVSEKFEVEKSSFCTLSELQPGREGQLNVKQLRQAQLAGGVGLFEWLIKENRAIFTPELEALYGLQEGTLQVGLEAWSQLVAKEDAVRVTAEIRRCMLHQESEHVYEFRALLPDGRHRWLRGQAQFFYDPAGAPERMIGVNIDIDAQKRAEAQLQESERRLRAIFDGTSEYISLLSPDGTLLETNQALLQSAGINHEEVKGKKFWEGPWFSTTTGASRQIQDAALRAARGELVQFELKLDRLRNEAVSLDVSLRPMRDQDGSVVLIVFEGRNINQRKAAEALLLEQWRSFDAALSHIPDFIFLFDLAGRFTYANGALLNLWQMTSEEALGKTFSELQYTPELASRLNAEIEQVIRSKQPLKAETPYAVPNGVTRFYEYLFVPVFDSAGNVKAVAGSTRDITERTKAEEMVREDRRRWQELFQQTPAAIALFKGPQHRMEWVNKQFLSLVGRTDEAVSGRTFSGVLPEAEQQGFLTSLNNVYKTGNPFFGQETLFRSQRQDVFRDFYVDFVFLASRDVAGQIDGIFVHATDVTAMVLARKQLEESERQFRTLAESIPHLAWMADETGHIFWYNQRWYEYTGTKFEEMEGWKWQSVHDANLLPDVLSGWQAALKSAVPFEMTFPLKGANGAFRPFLTRSVPIKDDQGKVVRWFGTNTDVAGQLATENELRRMNRELEEFAFVASHDLQEPLRMVNIYTQLLLRRLGEDGKSYEQYANFIQQGVGRMETLLQDLLTFSRTIHADEHPETRADLSAALKEAMAVLEGRIQETGAIIETEPLPVTRGDTSQLAHVFQNVLANALKYRNPEATVHVKVKARQENHECVISVSDNGIGFESKYAVQIFGLFKRLYKHEYPGTGLGLAICKRIVERYGGRMWAESKVGEGSTFSFALPLS